MSRREPLVVDIFSGAGGFARGFEQAGFRIVAGIDNYPPAAKTFKANFPQAFVLAEDVKDVSGEELLSLTGLKRGEVDVLIGSPPCEPFTAANPNREREPLDRLYKDPIGQLVLHYVRLVDVLRPHIFIMENVPGIMEGGLKNAIAKEFRRIGYRRIYFNKLRAEDYGTPSHRLRVFISNVKLAPPKVHEKLKVVDALKGLPEPGSGYPPNHEITPLSERKLRKLSRLKWGRALVYYKGAKRMLPNLVRLHPYKLAPTVLGSSRFFHPLEDRILTVREQARLMGFPDYHVFLGGRDDQYNQVGEAVPVPLARAIALSIRDHILKEV